MIGGRRTNPINGDTGGRIDTSHERCTTLSPAHLKLETRTKGSACWLQLFKTGLAHLHLPARND
jgi:hypothetical protein